MSDVWLFLAIGSLFLAIVLVGVFIDQTIAERHRAVRLLESQVTGAGGQAPPRVDLREEERKENFGSRVFVPIVSRAGAIARRVTPLDTRDRISKKLLVAGSPAGWDAERVLAFKIIGAIAGFIGSLLLLQMRTLSDTLDLLTISVEAGLSLNAAIAQVVRNVPGVLSSEFARMLQEIQLGVPRSDAFRHLAERTDVDELNAFALAMIQADIFGVSIASVLRTQAAQLRIKRRQAIEAKAQQTPVKIVFPLVLCVLPALFVVIVGPGAIQIFNSFINLQS